MKRVNLLLCLVVVASLFATSCVENSEKYKLLLAERDSLLVVEQNYKNTLDIINEIEAGFQSIRELESGITLKLNDMNSNSQSKKDQLTSQIIQVKDLIVKNKEKIAELQNKVSKDGREKKSLLTTITRIEGELKEKVNVITSMQQELSNMNIKVEELSGTIEDLNKDVANLTDETAMQQVTIDAQDSSLHKAWYVVKSYKELKDANIVTSNGLFKPKSVLSKDFDKSVFTLIDIRELKTIKIDSKNPKILTNHPSGSYDLVVGEDDATDLNILNSQEFWSVSKYLVVSK